MPGACNAARAALRRTIDACAGYGGGVSVYFGLSVGLQLLDVAFFNLALLRNDFTRCTVFVSAGGLSDGFGGGNVYGGGLSVYMGGYSSSFASTGYIAAAVGDTAVRNASVRVGTASFTSCSATTAGIFGANSYGGSFSVYMGGYARSFSFSNSSSSRSGLTTASGVNVSISNVNSSSCSATTAGIYGANSYGGSMSAVYIGAYTWSNAGAFPGISPFSFASSVCGTTNVTGLVVSISGSTFANSAAASRAFSRCPLVFIYLR